MLLVVVCVVGGDVRLLLVGVVVFVCFLANKYDAMANGGMING